MIVIGSANSSNTLALERVAQAAGCGRVYRVNGADEIPDDLDGVVGVTAGASAPEELVRAVVERLAPANGVEVVDVTHEDEYFPPPRELRDLLRAVSAAVGRVAVRAARRRQLPRCRPLSGRERRPRGAGGVWPTDLRPCLRKQRQLNECFVEATRRSTSRRSTMPARVHRCHPCGRALHWRRQLRLFAPTASSASWSASPGTAANVRRVRRRCHRCRACWLPRPARPHATARLRRADGSCSTPTSSGTVDQACSTSAARIRPPSADRGRRRR